MLASFFRSCAFLLFTTALTFPLFAQPTTPRDDITIERLGTTTSRPVRIAHDSKTDQLYYLTLDGDVVEGTFSSVFNPSVLARIADHGLPQPRGMVFGPDGTLYLSGNARIENDSVNVGMVVRGIPTDDAGSSYTWSLVMQTEPYPLSKTAFDHTVNGITISPDGQYLFINSGSRTDHGEVQENGGLFPDTREVALTAKILRVPADTTDLLLLNDEAWLKTNGYIFAEGTRNHFDLAFAPDGELFGVENSGDRDDNEEMNWLREGRHYGFPWRMGTHDTPQRFDDYDPDGDPFVQSGAHAFNQGYFRNDPDYPPPPEGVTFTDPILNLGPDADMYRDTTDAVVKDASETGHAMRTFTSHRSPLGLVFDRDSTLGEPFTGDGFVMAWTGGGLLAALNDPGEDLLHLTLEKADTSYTVQVERIAGGFANPIDAELVGTELYIVEHGDRNGEYTAWKVTLPAGGNPTPGETVDLPDRHVLEANYPNPFNPTTTLRFALAGSERVTLRVFDTIGRQVAILLNDAPLNAGRHEVQFDAGRLPSGAYVYRLDAGAFNQTRTMLLLK